MYIYHNIMKQQKIIVFDMDETLGCFVQFGIFWDALQEYFNYTLTDNDFFEILDKYPEFIRPKMLSILKYLKKKKQKRHLSQVIIYTNNQGPKSWAYKIKDYFHYKLNYQLFDKVICAYKVNGKINEVCRTTYQKTITDFLRCCNLSNNLKICFIDDQYHPKMEHPIVDIITVKPYTHDLPYIVLIKRFLTTQFGIQLLNVKGEFKEFIQEYISLYDYTVKNKSKTDMNKDKIASKRLMYFLQDFFRLDHSPKTIKKKKRSKFNKTHKRIENWGMNNSLIAMSEQFLKF